MPTGHYTQTVAVRKQKQCMRQFLEVMPEREGLRFSSAEMNSKLLGSKLLRGSRFKALGHGERLQGLWLAVVDILA